MSLNKGRFSKGRLRRELYIPYHNAVDLLYKINKLEDLGGKRVAGTEDMCHIKKLQNLSLNLESAKAYP